MKRIKERDATVCELASEKGYVIDDLYSVSVSISKKYRYEDGTHYLEEGYVMLAEKVAECIRAELKK